MFKPLFGLQVYFSPLDQLASGAHREPLIAKIIEARKGIERLRRDKPWLFPELKLAQPLLRRTRRENFPALARMDDKLYPLGGKPGYPATAVSFDGRSGWSVIGRQTPFSAAAIAHTGLSQSYHRPFLGQEVCV